METTSNAVVVAQTQPGPTVAMAWLILLCAGALEVGWAVGLKYTQGFTRPIPTIATLVSMVLSLALLGWALRTLPLGTAYAVWTGIGTIGTAIFGIMVLGESMAILRVLCLVMVVAGIAGLKLFS